MINDTKSNSTLKIRNELLDSFAEELEEEIDDRRLEKILEDISDYKSNQSLDRSFYFKELFRLHHNLVTIHDWISVNKNSCCDI